MTTVEESRPRVPLDPRVWAILVSIWLGTIACFGLFSFWIQHNQHVQARKAAAAEARSAEQARAIVCRLFTTILDTYQESPPATAAGRAQVGAWIQVYELSRCQPPR
ncbi:hypothetical protein ACQPZX_41380 [Actinoplanes sp. CA-142083]|uniref:hypothetical protein n=1 Tax=Actinoplanes sp. CA-142083 TaxID=3239903 RepID=UPI003D8BFA47